MNNFKKDLEFGKHFELEALRVIDYVEDSLELAPEDEYFPFWDIKCILTGRKVANTFEVKADKMCKKTGNFFIETSNKFGKPSGLSLSRADSYILIEPDDNLKRIEVCYTIPTKTLREFELDREIRKVNYPSNGFLLPKSKLDEIVQEYEAIEY